MFGCASCLKRCRPLALLCQLLSSFNHHSAPISSSHPQQAVVNALATPLSLYPGQVLYTRREDAHYFYILDDGGCNRGVGVVCVGWGWGGGKGVVMCTASSTFAVEHPLRESTCIWKKPPAWHVLSMHTLMRTERPGDAGISKRTPCCPCHRRRHHGRTQQLQLAGGGLQRALHAGPAAPLWLHSP